MDITTLLLMKSRPVKARESVSLWDEEEIPACQGAQCTICGNIMCNFALVAC